MAIAYSGDTILRSNGAYDIGVTGTGSLVIDAGSTETWGDGTTQNPFGLIGQDAGSVGNVTITGAGSGLLLQGAGGDSGMHLGSRGTGTLTISNGGALDMVNAVSSDFSSQAGMSIGRRLTGDGTLNMTDASMSFTGSVAYFYVGRDGATGDANLDNSSIDVTGVRTNVYVGLESSNSGTTGNLDLTNGSSLSITSTTADGFADLGIGAFSTGGAGYSASLTSTASDISMLSDANAYIYVGNSNATGTMTIDGGTLDVDGGNFAGMFLGQQEGDGTVVIENGATATFDGVVGSFFNVGVNGGTASLTVDASSLTLTSSAGYAGINIGREFDGSPTTGASGTVDILNGSTLRIEGTGPVEGSYFGVGRDGAAQGTLNVVDSTMDLTAMTGAYSTLNVGRSGATGVATFDNSTLTLATGSDGVAGIRVGRQADGDGKLTFDNGSVVSISGPFAFMTAGSYFDETFTPIEPSTDAEGLIEVLGGSTVTLTGGSGPDEFGIVVIGGDPTASSAKLVVDGSGSVVEASDTIIVGTDPEQPAGTVESSIVVTDGGLLRADTLQIGLNGELATGNATLDLTGVDGSLESASGTWRLLEDGPTTVNGDIFSEATNFVFDVSSDGSSAGKIVQNGGFFVGIDAPTYTIETGLGYQFAAGDSYDLLETNAAVVVNDLVDVANDTFGVNFVVNGQDADFGYSLSRIDVGGTATTTFTALNNGDGTGVAMLDFGATSMNGVSFSYDTVSDFGFGSGGDLGDVTAINIDSVSGTAASDFLSLAGLTGFTIDGRGGDDILSGSFGNDLIIGGSGEDIINGSVGDDTVDGGADDDSIRFLEMGRNAGELDTWDGGTGSDTADFSLYHSAVRIDLTSTNEGITRDSDTMGSGTFRVIVQMENMENIVGSDFSDQLWGDNGDNVISGGDGADNMLGLFGNDTLFGGAGNDFLFARQGADEMYGGAGNDRIIMDSLDTVVSGGDDYDRVSVAGSGGVTLDMNAAEIERAAGNSGDDTFDATGKTDFRVIIQGNGGIDTLSGGELADSIAGGTESDTLFGNGGADKLYGEAGSDVLNGGLGRDQYFGGAGGFDVYEFSADWDRDLIRDFGDGMDTIRFDGVTDATGGTLEFSDLTLTQDAFGNARVFVTGVTANTITLAGVDFNDLDASDFDFA